MWILTKDFANAGQDEDEGEGEWKGGPLFPFRLYDEEGRLLYLGDMDEVTLAPLIWSRSMGGERMFTDLGEGWEELVGGEREGEEDE